MRWRFRYQFIWKRAAVSGRDGLRRRHLICANTEADALYAATVPPAGYVITPSGQQPTRSVNDAVEFRRNYGANQFINALYALDSGYTGQGVTVGVIDDGANTKLSELAGQIDVEKSEDFGLVTAGGVTTKRDSLGDAQSDHGTAVTTIISGRRDGNGAMGYALTPRSPYCA